MKKKTDALKLEAHLNTPAELKYPSQVEFFMEKLSITFDLNSIFFKLDEDNSNSILALSFSFMPQKPM